MHPRSAPAALWTLALLAGCNAILGLDETTDGLDSAGGSAGAGGAAQAGKGGASAGAAGAAGTASGAGGQAGAPAGSAGSPAGSAGAAGNPAGSAGASGSTAGAAGIGAGGDSAGGQGGQGGAGDAGSAGSAGQGGKGGSGGQSGSAGKGGAAGASGQGGSGPCEDGTTAPCSEDATGTPVAFPGGAPKEPCKYGTKACINGKYGPCSGLVAPATDTCGHDESCNGVPSEASTCNPGGKADCPGCGKATFKKTCDATCAYGACEITGTVSRKYTAAEAVKSDTCKGSAQNGTYVIPKLAPGGCEVRGPNEELPPGHYRAAWTGSGTLTDTQVQIGVFSHDGTDVYDDLSGTSFQDKSSPIIAEWTMDSCQPIDIVLKVLNTNGVLTLTQLQILCLDGPCKPQ